MALGLSMALGLTLTGCASRQTWLVNTDPCVEPDVAATGLQAVAYTTADGVRHPFAGTVYVTSSGELTFEAASRRQRDALTFSMPASEVQSVEYEQRRSRGSSFVVGFAAGMLLGLGFLYAVGQ
jgi:hypothetical protein